MVHLNGEFVQWRDSSVIQWRGECANRFCLMTHRLAEQSMNQHPARVVEGLCQNVYIHH